MNINKATDKELLTEIAQISYRLSEKDKKNNGIMLESFSAAYNELLRRLTIYEILKKEYRGVFEDINKIVSALEKKRSSDETNKF